MQTLLNSSKKVGRPDEYSEEKGKEICKMIESGLTLTSICNLPDMPHISTIYDWQDAHPEFAESYARARSRQADTLASKVLDEAMSSHDAQIGRLRIDALKWTASKLSPKKYGDKVEVEQIGNTNFKISFSVPERDTLNSLKGIELPAPDPQLIDIQAEKID